jgi:hypothetical protein
LNVFVNGTTADGTQVNANFNSLIAAGNNINSTNIGSLGVYANQIIPTTAAQATFGGSLAYTFPAGVNAGGALTATSATLSASSIPLVLNQAYGQDAIKLVSATSSGFSSIGPTSVLVKGVIGSAFAFNNYGVANLFTIDGAGNVGALATLSATNIFSTGLSALSSPSGYTSGDLIVQRTSLSGVILIGGAGSCGTIDWGITNANAMSFRNLSGGYAGTFGGLYTNASDASLKTNVTPISGSLSKITALQASAFDWIIDGKSEIGFVAQDVQAVFPEACSTDNAGLLGYAPSILLAHLWQAFTEYVATHP